MSSRITAAIAVGSNLGDRERTLKRAQALLEKTQGVVLLRRSAWHETQPVGGPADQGPFLNGVFLVATSLDALALLKELQRIETGLGRDRSNEVPNGPRTMDLDLLWHGTTTSASDELTLPHAGLEERIFVLAPLAEILPDHPLPGCQRTVQERLDQLRTESVA